MPCPAHLFHIAPRHKSASSSSLAPALSAARRSTSRSLNRHDRIVPSAVIRVRSHSLQNERVTEAMIPTVIVVPSTRHSSAGADGSSRPIASNSKRLPKTDNNSAAVTMFWRAHAWSASRGICSIKRNSTPASRHHCKRSAAPWSVSRISTALIFSGASPGRSCRSNSRENGRQPVSTRQFSEMGAINRIQGNIDASQTSCSQLRRTMFEPNGVGSHGKWNSWHARGAPPDDLFEVTTHQRFAAGESHLANTDSFDADSDYSNDLVGTQKIFRSDGRQAFLRHAIRATK